MSPAAATDMPIPAHVPDRLVRQVNFRDEMAADVHSRLGAIYQGPDIVYTPTFHNPRQRGGAWLPVRARDIRAILMDSARFGNKGTSKFSEVLGETWDLIPSELDPPHHGKYRKLIAPLFGPARINQLVDDVRVRAERMIADFAGGREGDFVEAFTKPFPAGVFLDMMGLPEEHSARFVEWAGTMIASSDQQALVSTLKKIIAYLREVIAARIAQPRDDLVSLAVSAEVDGEKLNDEEVLGLCVLLFNAGLDTIGSALSFQIRHLAEHPEHQRALRDDPSLIPRAVDELARAYSVVNVIRVVREDTEYGGVTMRKGDRVICSTLLAGRDPDEFADPDRIDFTRKGAGHHLGFGTGIHLCIGATLAKREIGIAIAELLARLPEFRVRPGEELTAHGGGTVGLKRLPLVW